MLEDEAGYVLLKQQNLKSVDPANFQQYLQDYTVFSCDSIQILVTVKKNGECNIAFAGWRRDGILNKHIF